MNGRSASALVAMLALVTTVFAGCVQPDWLNAASTKAEISALEDKDLADNAAKAWDAKAQLLSVFTLELGTNQSQNDIPLDPAVGNGKAPVWFFVYCAMDGDNETNDGATAPQEGTHASSDATTKPAAPPMAVFRVTADGKVAQEKDQWSQYGSMPGMGMQDIGAWKVDSPAALDAAKANQTFVQALNAPNASLAQGVAIIEDKTAWYFAAGGEKGIAVAIVDAATGKLLEVRTMKLDFTGIPNYARPKMMPMAPPLDVQGKGTVGPQSPKKEFPFAYDGGDTLAALHIKANSQTPFDGMTWKLLGPDGKEIKAKETSGSQAPSPGSRQADGMHYKLADPGEYKLVFQYSGFTGRVPIGAPVPIGGIDFSFVLSNAMKDTPKEH